MEKKILFCNIAWMKNYVGVNAHDKPLNGGKYIKDMGIGGEVYNFLDDNGICHGFVRIGGKISLESHYKDAAANDPYVDDVLVVWVATNKNKQTRIVGWYKNARVYREDRDLVFYTDQSANSYYNIEAEAIDCYLLPEDQRTFTIPRANEVGQGMGMGQSNIWYAESTYAKANIVPKVIQFIEEYDGDYANEVYQEDVIKQRIDGIEFLDNFDKLYEEGLKAYDENDYSNAIIYFKAAQRIDEPIELLRKLAKSLFYRYRYSEAIVMFNRIIESEGETAELLEFVLMSYDFLRNRDKIIEYCHKIINLEGGFDDEAGHKRSAYCIIFDIYIDKGDFKMAKETIENLDNYLSYVDGYSKKDHDDIIKLMKDILRVGLENKL